ncbi:hypothetical protein MtrunA17_Chr3g0086171 [Medicago truncatula]|uniref:Uncharacterized protein n=1 Tax=Medicago truncatula TaxID=3880 RepID=A0A396IN60_MEDTR|nr:hypothetical protein MtrunA17_Chr3g0086171 [Medicago truncatula]
MVWGAPPPRRTVGVFFARWWSYFCSSVVGGGVSALRLLDVVFGSTWSRFGFVNPKGSGFINPKGLFGYNALNSSHDLGSSAS